MPHKQIKVAVENGYLTLTDDVEYNYQKSVQKRLYKICTG